jgi:hypothetical protein
VEQFIRLGALSKWPSKITLDRIGSWVSHTFHFRRADDPTHHLSATADSAGNRMTHTLDVMGNHTSALVRVAHILVRPHPFQST